MNQLMGWAPRFDERSRGFPVGTWTGPRAPVTKLWPCNVFLDQGSEGACVGFAWAHATCAPPQRRVVTGVGARMIYRSAQTVDQWRGEDYSGTSVLAGAKTMSHLGYLTEYRWAFSLDDVVRAVSHVGPVVIGVNWYEGMMSTRPAGSKRGYVVVEGGRVGGHAIMVQGVNVEERFLALHNSWGVSWGNNGCARLSWGDMERLIDERAECCVPRWK